MSLENRKANINFLGPDHVLITNIYYQKTFWLKDSCTIDLFYLKDLKCPVTDWYNNVECPFFACFEFNKHHNCYIASVALRPKKNSINIVSTLSYNENNNQTISGAVYVG